MGLVAVIYVLAFCYFFQASLLRAPVYDVLDWVLHWRDVQQSGDWVGYFLTPHNEHRIAWSRLLLLIDVEVFAGTGTPFYVAGAILLCLLVTTILRQAWLTNLPQRPTLAFLLLLVTTPTAIVVTCSMPAMGVFLQTSAFAVLSLALLGDTSASVLRRAGALLCAMAAAFGVAGGLLIWPVLLWYCWRRGHGLAFVALVALVGAVFVGLYLAGLPREAISTNFDPASIISRIDYLVRFLGLPWSHSAMLVWPGRCIGAAILLAGSLLLLGDLMRPRSTPSEQFGLALLLFVLLLAVAAAIARFDVAADRAMPVRYSIFVTLAHAGLILALSTQLSAWLTRPVARSAVGIVAFVLLVQQFAAGIAAERETQRYARSWEAFVAGAWSPEMTHYVYPDHERATTGLRFMQERGLYRGPFRT